MEILCLRKEGMRIKMKKALKMIGILILLIVSCSGCNNKEDQQLKKKMTEEIEFIDTHIISMLNSLNDITFDNYVISSQQVKLGEGTKSEIESTDTQSSSQQGSGNSESGGESSGSSNNEIKTTEMTNNNILSTNSNNIDWENIKSQIETLDYSWSVIILDLYNLNTDSTEVLAFSDTLNSTMISIKNENKQESLNNLAKLYSYLPSFLKMISAENSNQNIKQAKSYIVNAYSQIDLENWDTINTNITEAEKTFRNIVNDLEYSKNKEYKVNKSYILIKEMQSSLNNKDKQIFFVKYKNVMESISSL